MCKFSPILLEIFWKFEIIYHKSVFRKDSITLKLKIYLALIFLSLEFELKSKQSRTTFE